MYKVLTARFDTGTRPLLDQTFVVNGEKGFNLKVDGDFLIVEHDSRGVFAVPLTSVSWMKVEPKVRKKRKNAEV